MPQGSSDLIRASLIQSTRRCSAVVVYGGDQSQRRAAGNLVPWRELHEFDWGASGCIVIVRAGGRPVIGASVLALFPNKTWKKAVTDESGAAMLDLHSAQLPMTVFIAAKGFAAHLERAWKPADGPLDAELTELPDGGAVIFPNGAGHVPVLRGRLNPIRDDLDRTCLYADNIAVNGGLQQPAGLALGEELRLGDAEGQEATVRIVDIVGRAALVQYHQE